MKKFLVLIVLLCTAAHAKYFSQSGQDEFVHKTFFKNKQQGTFVDIGAFNGIHYSNSYFFEDNLGWSGICIEPIPAAFKELKKMRSCISVKCCIAPYNGQAEFLHVIGYDMLSGIIKNYQQEHLEYIQSIAKKEKIGAEIITVDCITFNNLMRMHGITHIDFLSLDTEGGEYEILKSIDFNEITISVMTIENNYNEDRIRILLESKGYEFVTKLQQDEIYKVKGFGEEQ